MNTVLRTLLCKCVLVFFDDILVYNKTLVEHIVHLQQVLELLSASQWRLKLSKCQFAQQSISYLGHVIGTDSVSTDPSKIEDVRQWPSPTNAKEL